MFESFSFQNMYLRTETDTPDKPDTPTPTGSGTCPKCGLNKKSGKRSCCANGGAWEKKCGDAGDSKFDHTWFQGLQACKSTLMIIFNALE